MSWFDRIKSSHVKIAAYITGTLYVLINIASLVTVLLLLKGEMEREKQITISIKSIILIPMIPFYLGVVFGEMPLCFPVAAGILYGLCADALYVTNIIMGVSCTSGHDAIFDSIVFGSVGIHMLFAVALVAVIVKVWEESKHRDAMQQAVGQYALRRFDAIPVSYEMERLYLEMTEQEAANESKA